MSDPTAPRDPDATTGVRLGVVLGLVCLLLGVATVVAWWRHQYAAEPAARTITSVSARASGLSAASRLTGRVLSYDWRHLEQDVAASEEVLAPSFRAQYARAMAGVRTPSVRHQVTVTAVPKKAAVVSATSTKVVALVFVDQTTTARGTATPRLDQNRVLVTLTRHGGEWRVSTMDAF